MTRRLTGRTALTLAVLGLTTALAAPPPQYQYGEMWWAEYAADRATDLLLHFGPPTATSRQKLATTVQAHRDEEQLLQDVLEIDAVEQGGKKRGDVEVAPMPSGAPDAPPAVDESKLPPGTVADYSERLRKLPLGAGMSLAPDGRFGAALRTEGKQGLAVKVTDPQAAECWFRVEKLPAAEACLFSLGRDESRLLLRPDGRLELRLRKPRGNPDPKRLSPELVKWLGSRPSEIVAPDPVPLNDWVHVAVYSIPHPAPGNTGTWEVMLQLNGARVAHYQSESGNQYDFFGARLTDVVIGDSAAGGQAFAGWIDEVRVSSKTRDYYERPALPWRDAAASRPLQFDRPFFRSDGTVAHASFDRGAKLELDRAGAGDVQVELHGGTLEGLVVDGIRGKGWVMDPDIGFARVPLKGVPLKAGALEFWLRPQNWDDCTGYWQHTPPRNKDLSVARLYARGTNGAERLAFNVMLPRAYNLERARVPVDPGHWLHCALVWDAGGWGLFVNDRVLAGQRRTPGPDQEGELAFVEFGVRDDVTAIRNEKPRIEVDEVVGYRAHLRADEVAQAHRRWMGELKPIPLYDAAVQYKWSLRRLEVELTPLLPEGVTPASAVVALHSAGSPVRGPVEIASPEKGSFRAVLNDGPDLPFGKYELQFQVRDPAGKPAVAGTREWTFEAEPWRQCAAGILDKVPPPWTPIRAEGNRIATRMSTFELGADGLPSAIAADGVPLLAAPFQLREDGKPMTGRVTKPVAGPETAVEWAAEFAGATCDVAMQCRAEYDGMVRYELALKPKGTPGRLAFVMPLQADRARRWLAYPVGERGPRTGEVPAGDGLVLTSRADPASYQDWKRFQSEQKADPTLTWESWWGKVRDGREAYGFYTHADLNDLNRGLWWFCDNAAGWAQSKKQGAVEIVRKGETVALELNLVAEAGDYVPGRPIVFGILPHPARPLPAKHRLFNKGVDADPVVGDVYDAFFPWPMDPRPGSMVLFPAADPKNPAAGPSWDYAQSCAPALKACKPRGLRTMYLSKAWFSCRAGAYDGWEWRSGESSAVYLTPWFNNYLCWEMNEWIGRDIFNALYLDECYEHPARNLEAGASVRLPDGTEQPGVSNFAFRELMKRWRGIFVQHGRDPFLIAHLTYSWQYQGIVFCDSYLDGENRPIVSLNSRDWLDSTSKTQFEVLQNARLWGVSSFYMPFIAEGGFDDKTKSQYPKWQWRMARQAQSQFAHYETSTVYEGQGSDVYKAYWKSVFAWGGAEPAKAAFCPYWDNGGLVQVEGQGGDTLVSLYRQPGKALVIASNRSRKPQTLRIQLDPKVLGLRDGFAARDMDTTFRPPEGEDFVPGDVGKETQKAFETMEQAMLARPEEVADATAPRLADEGEISLDDPDEVAAAQWQALEPRVENGVLVLPVRPRDFRLVAVE